jgi:hypothetical protein
MVFPSCRADEHFKLYHSLTFGVLGIFVGAGMTLGVLATLQYLQVL